MKIKLLLGLLILVFMTGCIQELEAENPPVQRLSHAQNELTEADDEIRLLNGEVIVKRGEEGSLTIKGRPGEIYSITSTYFRGGKELTSYMKKSSGPDGVVTWTWSVAPDTLPGTYPITIAGAGRVLKASYSVVQ